MRCALRCSVIGFCPAPSRMRIDAAGDGVAAGALNSTATVA